MSRKWALLGSGDGKGLGDILYCPCEEGKRKKSSFVKTAGYKTVSIFGTLLP
jgi:hypothetical protein